MDQTGDEVARLRARVAELEAAQWMLERRVFQLQTLAAIAHEAGSCRDVASAARSVLSVLSGTFGATSGVVLLHDEEADAWTVEACRGVASEVAPPSGAAGGALLDWLEEHPGAVLPHELPTCLDSLADLLGGVFAAAPMVRQGGPTGLVVLGRTLSGDPAGPGDLELCTAAAAAAAHVLGSIIASERHLRQQQERFRIQGIFEQYCAPDVVQRLLAEQDGLRIGAEQKVVSVLMADMRGFTRMVQRAHPEQITTIVNAYLTAMNEVVFAHGGTMDKFIGDAVMAIFGDPVSGEDDALRAVRCAVEMHRRFATLAAAHVVEGSPLGLGVGVTTGSALCGIFGSPRRFQYTVMGPVVNLAARLSRLARRGQTLVDGETQARVGGWIGAVRLPPTQLKGFGDGTPVFSLQPWRPDT